MTNKVKEGREKLDSSDMVREIELPIGEVIEFSDGMSVYVIPTGQFKQMGQKQLEDIKRELDAQEILLEAEVLGEKQRTQGWTREDFKKDFIETRDRIVQFLNKKKNARK